MNFGVPYQTPYMARGGSPRNVTEAKKKQPTPRIRIFTACQRYNSELQRRGDSKSKWFRIEKRLFHLIDVEWVGFFPKQYSLVFVNRPDIYIGVPGIRRIMSTVRPRFRPPAQPDSYRHRLSYRITDYVPTKNPFFQTSI